MRGWTPISLAIDRVLRLAAANKTIRARFKTRCVVTGERQRASSTLRSLFERWTSLASGIIPILNRELTLYENPGTRPRSSCERIPKSHFSKKLRLLSGNGCLKGDDH